MHKLFYVLSRQAIKNILFQDMTGPGGQKPCKFTRPELCVKGEKYPTRDHFSRLLRFVVFREMLFTLNFQNVSIQRKDFFST